MRKKRDEGQITPEEKEMLRRLMETPGIEKEWDFFEGMSPHIPPPEFFMRGKPEPRFKRTRRVLAACACIMVMLACSAFIATFMVPDEVNADKNPFEILVSNIRNGFVDFKPQTEGDEPSSLETEISGTVEEAIVKARRVVPDLLEPTYVPEEYTFESIKIKEMEDSSTKVAFLYHDMNGNNLLIHQTFTGSDIETAFNNSVTDGEDTDEDVLLYKEDKVNRLNALTVWKNSKFRIDIKGVFEKNQLETIYKGLQE